MPPILLFSILYISKEINWASLWLLSQVLYQVYSWYRWVARTNLARMLAPLKIKKRCMLYGRNTSEFSLETFTFLTRIWSVWSNSFITCFERWDDGDISNKEERRSWSLDTLITDNFYDLFCILCLFNWSIFINISCKEIRNKL